MNYKKLLLIIILAYIIYALALNINLFDNNKSCSTQKISWGLRELNINSLQEEGITGENIRIAIMDSGIDFEHLEFGDNIKEGYNAIEPGCLPVDESGHGTLVSGIIASQNNLVGLVGVAPKAEIYPIKVLDKYGEGNINNIINGIKWCIENNIQIINMSFALLIDDKKLKEAIDEATDSGIIIVASAFNSSNEIGYPAKYENVFSVIAIDHNFKIHGNTNVYNVDFAAPGINIISTAKHNQYEEVSGNSFATPFVTGVIALILQKPERFGIESDGKVSVTEIHNAIENNFNEELIIKAIEEAGYEIES